MIKWRRQTLLGLAVVGAAGALSCARAGTESPLRIVSSFYPVHIHVLNIVRDVPGVEAVSLAPPAAGCLHDVALKPGDLLTLARADVFVVNGLGMETYLEDLAARLPNLRVVRADAGIEPLPGHHGANPHVWVAPSGALAQVRAIAAGLAEADPAHAGLYRANADAYAARLEALRDRMRAGLREAPRRELVTFHEAFDYFAREFDLRIAAVIAPDPDAAPGARELAEVARTVRERGIRALFVEPQFDARAAETIARETGARVYTLDSAVTGPDDPDAYLRIQEANLKTLREALGAPPAAP